MLSHGQPKIEGADPVRDRDSIVSLYRQHTDTMTINTWVNIMTANKYLKAILQLDSLIVLQNIDRFPEKDSLISILQDQNHRIKTQLDNSYAQLSTLRSDQENKADIILYGLILAAAVILILVFLLIIYIQKSRKNAALHDKLKNAQTKLYFAGEELQQLKMNQPSKEEDRNEQLEEEISLLKKNYESLSDEKLMLENQIIEVKKAWELEVQKRMDAELTGGGSDKRTEKKLQRRINALEAENEKLSQGSVRQQRSIEDKDEQLKILQRRLEELAATSEQKSSRSVDDNKQGDDRLKADYEELFKANKDLVGELAETKKNYEKEIKTRLEIESELRELLEKLRNKYL